jgi:glycosyltransferase involved in cell wall biosynthesis
MPVHNGAKWLNTAIDSVLAQTFKDFEFIIINDGSRDNSEAIVLAYKDSRIKYLQNEKNMGVQATRNQALSIATGEFVAMIDQDDEWIDVGKLKKQMTFLINNKDYVLVGTGAVMVDEDGNELVRYLMPATDRKIRSKILRANPFVHSSVMFRAEDVRSLGGYDQGKLSEDLDLWMRLGRLGMLMNFQECSVKYLYSHRGYNSQDKIKRILQNIKLAHQHKDNYPGYLIGVFFGCTKLLIYPIFNLMPGRLNDLHLKYISLLFPAPRQPLKTYPKHMISPKNPKVAILLCTYQGQKHLEAQLDSFVAQTHTNWELWVSDDGSIDGTHAILDQAVKTWGRDKISIHNGPREGFCANFLSLTCNANIKADYYAYSDQDDIWQSEKLERALAMLDTVPQELPAMYCSRTLLVDAEDNLIGMSPLFSRNPGFKNALTQNICGGNTMVFNKAARQLLIDAGEKVQVVTHDWWAYLLVSGCGGRVFYDPKPTIRYRQHDSNLVGMNSSWPSRLKRIRQLFKGHFREWNDLNVSALLRMRSKLTIDNRATLDQFITSRQKPLIPRLKGLKKSGIYRQTIFGSLGLVVAAIFNKI